MTTEELKSEIKKFVDNCSDESILVNAYNILSSSSTEDFWDKLSEQEKKEIEEGLEDCEKGNVISHEEAMKQIKKFL